MNKQTIYISVIDTATKKKIKTHVTISVVMGHYLCN